MLLSYGKPDEVRAHCRKVIDGVARDGGYIMDAGAIMQDDTSIENLRALTDFTREHGVYSAGSRPAATTDVAQLCPVHGADVSRLEGLANRAAPRIKPGICLPWETKATELPPITGDQDLVRRVWENVEALGNTYIWQLLLSF